MKSAGGRIDVLIAIPVLLVGGTEMHTLALAQALQSAGARVRVCCYYEYALTMVRVFEERGVEISLLQMERASGHWNLFLVLRRLFKIRRPDVVHVQYISPGLLPVAAARFAGVRTVFATVHQTGDHFGLRQRLLFAVAARLCTTFFCVSQAVERSWFGDAVVFSRRTSASGRRHFTIYNCIDTAVIEGQSFDANPEELKAKLGLSGRRVIGVVARLRTEKGHALLLDALPLVLKVVPDAALLVVGDGPDRAALMEQGRALGVLPQVVWAGERSRTEVQAFYGAMDVVAVPSQYEGFGLSAAEAMATGRPVVATRVGGLPEIVEDGVSGYLIDPGDSAALALALIRLLIDPVGAAKMGACGRARVLEYFTSERFASSVVAAYGRFTKDRGSSGGAAPGSPRAEKEGK